MNLQVEAGHAFADQYGPYAFGIVAFIVILATLSVVWSKVFRPALDTLLQISITHERTTGNIDRATERLERMQLTKKQETH